MKDTTKWLAQVRKKVKIEVWSFDEHRLGLKPIIRRVWTKKGKVHEAIVNPGYKWFYLYGFVHPCSGRSHWLILPRVDIEVFNIALKDFAQRYVKFGKKEILLVLDRAGWHTSMRVKWPDGIHPEFLPPYSPELQPAERLWQLTDQPFVNRAFDTLDQMEDIAVDRCRQVMNMRSEVSSLTHFHWWPDDPPVYIP